MNNETVAPGSRLLLPYRNSAHLPIRHYKRGSIHIGKTPYVGQVEGAATNLEREPRGGSWKSSSYSGTRSSG